MKYKSTLKDGILLRRYLRFLVDIALQGKKRKTIYCPNLGSLLGCDILGSKIWYSTPTKLSRCYLDVLELVEVDGGNLVSINPEYVRPIVVEAIHKGMVPELQGYNFLQINNIPTDNFKPSIELLINQLGEQCFIYIEQVLFGDERGDGYFPETASTSIAPIQELIALREIGHKTILFYCVQNSGVKCVKTADIIAPWYGKAIREAAAAGVEILAYRTNITLEDISLGEKIPVFIAEDITSR